MHNPQTISDFEANKTLRSLTLLMRNFKANSVSPL